MKLIIKRKEKTKTAIAGTLTIDGQYICDTAENRLTALSEGEYRIVRHYCKQYHRFMPLVMGYKLIPHNSELRTHCAHCNPQITEEEVSLNTVMPCPCPMLTPGNGVHHRKDGSILLGTEIVPGCLSHPLQAFNPLAERIRKAIKRNKVITLVIQRSIATKDLEYIKQ